jgi:4-carboxymuconolactone decarboxylase
MWMHSPEVAKAMFDVRRKVRYGSAKDQRLTELTIISTAREIDSQYIYTAHEPAARNAGLEQEIIDIVRFQVPLDQVVETDGLGEREKAIIQFAREVINEEKVSSETFAKAIELFGNEGVMDLTGLIGYYNFVSMTVRVFDVQRPIGNELLLPIRVGQAGSE